MRTEWKKLLVLVVLALAGSTGTMAQSGTVSVSSESGPGGTTVAVSVPADSPTVASEMALLNQLLADQTRAYEEQRALNAQQQTRVAALESELRELRGEPASAPSPSVVPLPADQPAPKAGTGGKPPMTDQNQGNSDAPLYFKIGAANFTPGGFVDLTTVFRSKAVGSGIGTSFGAIPFNTAASYPAAGLTELRMTDQNSRLSLKVDAQSEATRVVGYMEADFLGNNGTTMYVTSNSATMRLRLAFVDVTNGKWEILGGQGWSLLTPNRKGLSPMTGDIFYSLDADANYQLGIPWARQAQLRVVYHPNNDWALGFSAENPQQFTGSALTLPSGFATTQVDTNGATWGDNTNTPNVHPDLIVKAAYDSKIWGRSIHFDAAGIYRTFRVNSFAAATQTMPAINGSSTAGGAGGSFNSNVELFRGFHFIENAFWSNGGGRYLLGLVPDFVIRPAVTSGLYTISPVHAGSGVAAFEWQATPKIVFFAYYSGVFATRNYQSVAPNTTCGAIGYCGYGFPGSGTTNNRNIQEETAGASRTVWAMPSMGKVVVLTQVSYVRRFPWYSVTTQPFNAHLTMAFMTVRYILP